MSVLLIKSCFREVRQIFFIYAYFGWVDKGWTEAGLDGRIIELHFVTLLLNISTRGQKSVTQNRCVVIGSREPLANYIKAAVFCFYYHGSSSATWKQRVTHACFTHLLGSQRIPYCLSLFFLSFFLSKAALFIFNQDTFKPATRQLVYKEPGSFSRLCDRVQREPYFQLTKCTQHHSSDASCCISI